MVIAVIGIGGVGGYFGGKLTQGIREDDQVYFYCVLWTYDSRREKNARRNI